MRDMQSLRVSNGWSLGDGVTVDTPQDLTHNCSGWELQRLAGAFFLISVSLRTMGAGLAWHPHSVDGGVWFHVRIYAPALGWKTESEFSTKKVGALLSLLRILPSYLFRSTLE